METSPRHHDAGVSGRNPPRILHRPTNVNTGQETAATL